MAPLLLQLAALSNRTAMIIAGVFGLFYFWTLYDDGSSIQNQINRVQQEIQVQEQKAIEADTALKEVEQVRTTVGELSEQFKVVSQALPSEVAMSDIIKAVDMVSRASGVSIKSKEPRPVVNRDYYEEIPLRISLEGTYAEVTMFLYYLASTERIMKANNFNLAVPTSGEKVNPGRLLFDGQIVSYRFIGTKATKEKK
jgi:type IV pilus assembly protein PilO